jgi:hypothetical protein
VSHTYAVLDVDRATFEDIKRRLIDAGHAPEPSDVIDMHGIGIRIEEVEPQPRPRQRRRAS